MEHTQYPYAVKEYRHIVSGYRYYTVYLRNKLVIITKNKRVAEEYIELNKKNNGSSTSTSN